MKPPSRPTRQQAAPRSGAAVRASDAGNRLASSTAAPAAAPRAVQVLTPEQQAQRLRDTLQALDMPLPEATQQQLLAYLGMLQQWNSVYNLTALRSPDEMLSHHLADCLAIIPALRRHAQGRPLRVLDVGSGGGLPGVVIAILQPDWRVSCVDTVSKKASFIRQVAVELGLPQLRALHARVEELDPGQHSADLITSRAFASLPDFTRLTKALLAEDGVWMAMKGQRPDDEQAALPETLNVFHVEQVQVPGLDAQRCLVWMRPAS